MCSCIHYTLPDFSLFPRLTCDSCCGTCSGTGQRPRGRAGRPGRCAGRFHWWAATVRQGRRKFVKEVFGNDKPNGVLGAFRGFLGLSEAHFSQGCVSQVIFWGHWPILTQPRQLRFSRGWGHRGELAPPSVLPNPVTRHLPGVGGGAQCAPKSLDHADPRVFNHQPILTFLHFN